MYLSHVNFSLMFSKLFSLYYFTFSWPSGMWVPGNPLQYSCLEYPMDRWSLAGYSPQGHKDLDMTEATQHACMRDLSCPTKDGTMHLQQKCQILTIERMTQFSFEVPPTPSSNIFFVLVSSFYFFLFLGGDIWFSLFFNFLFFFAF